MSVNIAVWRENEHQWRFVCKSDLLSRSVVCSTHLKLAWRTLAAATLSHFISLPKANEHPVHVDERRGAMAKTHTVCKPKQCLSPTAIYSLNVACNSKKNINGVTHFNARSSSGTGHSGWQVFVHSNVKEAPKTDPYDVQHRMLMHHEALFGKCCI